MTTTQVDWSLLDAQLSEAAGLMRDHVDAEMAEVDSALRALAEDIHAQASAALTAVEQAAPLVGGRYIPAQQA